MLLCGVLGKSDAQMPTDTTLVSVSNRQLAQHMLEMTTWTSWVQSVTDSRREIAMVPETRLDTQDVQIMR